MGCVSLKSLYLQLFLLAAHLLNQIGFYLSSFCLVLNLLLHSVFKQEK